MVRVTDEQFTDRIAGTGKEWESGDMLTLQFINWPAVPRGHERPARSNHHRLAKLLHFLHISHK